MKKGVIWLAVVIAIIALCGAFYYCQPRGTADSPMTVTGIADVNNTANTSKDLTETTNTSNQSVFTVPLEKPPFID